MERVIFACVHNAGRSQIAEAFFGLLADPRKATAVSAGTQPTQAVYPEVVTVMHEAGVYLAGVRPQLLTHEVAEGASLLVTMGCGDECTHVPVLQKVDWALPDPEGQPVERVRAIRDEVRQWVGLLLSARGWGRSPTREDVGTRRR